MKKEFDFAKMAEEEENRVNLKIGSKIVGKIKNFSQLHPIRKKIVSGMYIPNDQGDRLHLTLIRYFMQNREPTDFYGVLTDTRCYCPCGAGGLSLNVYSLDNVEILNEVALKVEKEQIGFTSLRWLNPKLSTLPKRELFNIETWRHGEFGKGSWPAGSTISGVEINYPACSALIGMLTSNV